MPGRAYNPLGFEPDLHGELTGPQGKAREMLTEVHHEMMKVYVEGGPIPYEKAYEYLNRGEGDILGPLRLRNDVRYLRRYRRRGSGRNGGYP